MTNKNKRASNSPKGGSTKKPRSFNSLTGPGGKVRSKPTSEVPKPQKGEKKQ